jgi:diguanylate cyclase (GGDEF)-like protein
MLNTIVNDLSDSAELKLAKEVYESAVVIVEDSDIDFEIINALLAPQYIIYRFADAESLLANLNNLDVSLFILDYHLPGIKGDALCKSIRKQQRLSDIPIIIVTGETDAGTEHLFWEAGCSDFISKPFSATTLRKRVAKELKYQRLLKEHKKASLVDALTKVFNRRYLEIAMRQLSARNETPEISVLLVDIDYFKQFNDEYGHLAGDVALVKVANILKKALERKTDFVVRWGGEEFVLVLPHTNELGCKMIAERISSKLCLESIPHEKSEYEVLTLSIGAVTFSKPPDDWSQIFSEADKCLYKAKEGGRNKCVHLLQT